MIIHDDNYDDDDDDDDDHHHHQLATMIHTYRWPEFPIGCSPRSGKGSCST